MPATTTVPFTLVATVLTVYGIETRNKTISVHLLHLLLQQYLPFTVLKRGETLHGIILDANKLQQYLPFTVLKHSRC